MFYHEITALRALREKHKIKLGELAKASGIHISYLCGLEMGKQQVGAKSAQRLIAGYKKLKVQENVENAIKMTRAVFKTPESATKH